MKNCLLFTLSILLFSCKGKLNNENAVDTPRIPKVFKAIYPAMNCEVNSMVIYNGKLLCLTDGEHLDHCIMSWDGKHWSTFVSHISEVDVLAVYNNELYAAGTFTSICGIKAHGIAKWNGKNWKSVGDGINGGYFVAEEETTNGKTTVKRAITGSVSYMTVYRNELYITGRFDTAGNVSAHNLAKWDGRKWSSIGKDKNPAFNAMQEFNGVLYGAGYFNSIDNKPIKNIAKWNGNDWAEVGKGTDGNVRALTVFDDKLYACGDFTHAGDTTALGIANWNDRKWNSAGDGMNIGRIGSVGSMVVYGNQLYAGGLYDSIGRIAVNNSIAKWNKKTWGTLKMDGSDGWINAMIEYKGDLYIAGHFDLSNKNSIGLLVSK